jgi:hypothetical protein
MSTTESTAPSRTSGSEGPTGPQGEIDLVDLWLSLAKHLRLMAVTFIAFVLLGVAVALALPKTYRYSTTIEIGSLLPQDGVGEPRLIETPPSAVAKLNESYIPLALSEYRQRHPQDDKRYQIEASVAGKSDVVVLGAEGPRDEEAVQLGLQQSAVEKLVTDHQRVLAIERSRLQLEKSNQEKELADQQEKGKVLAAKLKRIDETRTLLQNQVADLHSRIASADARREAAMREATDEARAMTMIMLENEIRADRERLDEVEERLFIGLPSQTDELNNDISENARAQRLIDVQVANVQTRLDNIIATSAVVPPMRSLEPVGLGGASIVAVFALVGLTGAFFAALLAEFAARVRARRSGGFASPPGFAAER